MSEPIQETQAEPTIFWQSLTCDVACGLRFYSRLPIPALPWEQHPHALPDFSRLVRMLPVAGIALGLLPALVLAGSLCLGLAPWVSAALSIATMTLITGSLHEDGLADLADSFGGVTRERRLEIMRDSRIGSFGTSALILAFALRIGGLASLADKAGILAAFAAVLILACVSRTGALMPLVFLQPARKDGASYSVGQPTREGFWLASGLAALMAVVLGVLADLPLGGVLLMLALSGLSGLVVTRVASRHVGGHTGDIGGAAQQVAEIAGLIGLLIALDP